MQGQLRNIDISFWLGFGFTPTCISQESLSWLDGFFFIPAVCSDSVSKRFRVSTPTILGACTRMFRSPLLAIASGAAGLVASFVAAMHQSIRYVLVPSRNNISKL